MSAHLATFNNVWCILTSPLSFSAGGSFSSTRDFAVIGKAILSSQLLAPEVTRRWLKPTSFANGLTQGVGRPWEIIRMSMPDGSVVDAFTKAGDCESINQWCTKDHLIARADAFTQWVRTTAR